jgi:SlyX protein
MNEDRIIDIEIKLTRQEDLVETLNTALALRLKDVSEAAQQNPLNERPPHY